MIWGRVALLFCMKNEMKRAICPGRAVCIMMICVLAMLSLAGCGTKKGAASYPDTGDAGQDTGSLLEAADTNATSVDTALAGDDKEGAPKTGNRSFLADSLDEAVIRGIDEEGGRILLYSKKAGKSYFLTYDSSTEIKDRFDSQLVAGQLMPGDLVTIAFKKDDHKAKGIWLDPSIEKVNAEGNFSIHINAKNMEIGQQQYSLADDCLVIFKGKLLSPEDINENDILTADVRDKEIYALVITRGHGYVRLSGADAFEGGFLEFGNDRIMKVEKDALYVVPEGSYQMMISKGRDYGIKEIEVRPDEELLVDVSDIITDADRTGQIIFTITPPGAALSIDDQPTEYSSAVELSYGIHKVEVSAEGYKSVTQYIKVGSPASNLSIDLEEGEDKKSETGDGKKDENTSVSENNVSDVNAASAAAIGEYRVYIDGPALAELYVDDAYIGVLPASFPKTAGKHVISLRREGYINRSYTLDIDSGNNDNHYSFSSLKPAASQDQDITGSALSSLMQDALSNLSGN